MKMASLFCGAVVVLSLVGGRAKAQIDSNSTLNLYCGPVSSDCEVYVRNNYYDRSISEGENFNGIIDSFLSEHYYLYNLSSILSIDTFTHRLVLGFFAYHDNYPIDGEFLSVIFDTIPYIPDQSGRVRVQGIFPGNYSFHGLAGVDNGVYGGSCSDLGSVHDSVNLLIIPLGNGVAISQASSSHTSLKIISEGSAMIAFFDGNEYVRKLEIFSVLGLRAMELTISSGIQETEIPINNIPPGCYFARLGDQVAKFVVPPR